MTDNTAQPNVDPEAQPAALESEDPASKAPPGAGLGALLDHATKAKELAQSSLSSLVSKTDELREQAVAKVEEVKEASLAKLLETLDDFNSSLPIVREAGYTLEGITLGMGIPPTLHAEFTASQEASTVDVKRLLTQHPDKKLTGVLIKALHNAWLVQTKITIAGLKPTKLSVEVGLIPSVSVSFTP
jgi:hypothetical protein